MSKESYGVCWCFRRRFKFGTAEAPQEMKELFQVYSEKGIMSVDNLQKFIKEVQGEDKITSDQVEALMEEALDKHHHLHHRKSLNLEAFFRYLLSDINSPLPPLKVHHDMTAPVSHYYIYTGHNSYLTGNQLSSNCSDVPIIDALHRGVRVIELDMWPNSTKDNVHILHGGTLTTPVELLKCLKSIKEHAFVTSEYPVVLTLEDHLTPKLQAIVAKMVTETFGDLLYTSKSESFPEFPSPESLKKRIIISTKPPKEYLVSDSVKVAQSDFQKGNNSFEEKGWGTEVSDMKSKFEGIDMQKYEPEDAESPLEDDLKDENANLKQNADPEYKHLIAICARKRKGGIKDWFHDDPSSATRISLREHNLEHAVINHGADVIRFTRRNLLRIFPKGSRVDSSNYNPLIGWMHGTQMVAFNMQGHGRPLWLMQGLFRANGGCGYVKKPDILLKDGVDNEVFDPKRKLPVKQTLKVKIFMGEGWHLDFKRTHFDLYSPPDFYVKVGIAGVPADSVMKKTKTIEDNWIPTWNEEFEFPLTVPEMALLRIEVHEYDISEKDDFGGQTCLPMSELKTGIRAVPLHDEKGDKYKSVKLLARFDYV
ncbi:Phosphoinositide phospholipase C [Heracleum sosnowskyi]|uniref:Phosphoinositide phospholipase C n=1 Tax=Heracleum sosnowskyi TaxID=360622 RepID=A0AAD8MB10_9APIA|nr:Phosphoinositide phospholipase C [Heracleum sosnowskyi]